MAPKRKRASITTAIAEANGAPLTTAPVPLPEPVRSKSSRLASRPQPVNPNERADILDAPDALRASPEGEVDEELAPRGIEQNNESDSPLSDVPDIAEEKPKRGRKPKPVTNGASAKNDASKNSSRTGRAGPRARVTGQTSIKDEDEKSSKITADNKVKGEVTGFAADPEVDSEGAIDEEEITEALSRPPPVNSDYLPLPWKGRLGYACLNTYLRYSNPPVFSSRTCRIASILEHRHPLKDPSQPEHATKNRPDRDQPADVSRGMRYVENICLANARDIIKMVRWNDKYGIKFMRLSSEMFPFASHEEYGYKLAPFASETLAEAGKIIAELGHRVTTHPGQFTQLGSPRKQVIDNAFRDLEYHDEMLSLLKLPPQQDRDAVMILHMGGVFGSKSETLVRFRENYAKLSQSIRSRLVLENDDVSWSLHDLLPICEELNIPFVLDYHHHNIVFDSDKIREGTKDVMDYYPRIIKTWAKKGITPKMHYSEPTPPAITGRQRRKHSPRVATLPPCSDTMDLMIEAKDKEQAVFELMRTFKLPGYDLFNDIIPHVRKDDNKPIRIPAKKKKASKKKGVEEDEGDQEQDNAAPVVVPEEEVGMGGPDRRVYWPPGMEDWLRPVKRVMKKKESDEVSEGKKVPAKRKTVTEGVGEGKEEKMDTPASKKSKPARKPKGKPGASGGNVGSTVPTPSISDEEDTDVPGKLATDADEETPANTAPQARGGRKNARAPRVSYAEADHSD
ncbi:MAG: UV-damage endonuclease [Bathelium mastoideum]|nr:MAG: UV-damage endonuclease [Bathelium mastoideum]